MTTARTAFVAIAASTAEPPSGEDGEPGLGREVMRRHDGAARATRQRSRDEGSVGHVAPNLCRRGAGREPGTLSGMERSLGAVLLGTFTLRFSTGLTGTLLIYYLADLPAHGGPSVDAVALGAMTAAFYASELLLATPFGLLSDRWGHHRVMQFGPIFGFTAVILTFLTTNLLLLGGTRILEGASTAASVPSILGFIAVITAGDELLRGAPRPASRRRRSPGSVRGSWPPASSGRSSDRSAS